MTGLQTAPSSPARLRVGVTGHRLNKLAAEDHPRLERQVGGVLLALQQAVGSLPAGSRERPKLQIISPLAEGADRMVAKAALEHGAELIVLLPLPRDDYATDFATAASRAEYFALLESAKQVVEPQRRHAAERAREIAYAAVGVEVVEASDILIAVWDGEEASGTGGTAEVVDLARRTGRPVVWLTASGGEAAPAWCLLLADRRIEADATGAMVDIAKRILLGME